MHDDDYDDVGPGRSRAVLRLLCVLAVGVAGGFAIRPLISSDEPPAEVAAASSTATAPASTAPTGDTDATDTTIAASAVTSEPAVETTAAMPMTSEVAPTTEPPTTEPPTTEAPTTDAADTTENAETTAAETTAADTTENAETTAAEGGDVAFGASPATPDAGDTTEATDTTPPAEPQRDIPFEAAPAVSDAAATTAAATTQPATSEAPETTSLAVIEPVVTEPVATSEPVPTSEPVLAASTSSAPTVPYSTVPDGSPEPVVISFGADAVTLRGAVPSEAAVTFLASYAAANSQTPGVRIDSQLVVNPAVPIGVGVRVIELESPRFPEGSAEVSPEHAQQLNRVAAVMTTMPHVTVVVVGHADQRGSEAANLDLSQQRADAVIAYLADQGVEGWRLSARAVGEAELLSVEEDVESLTLNRRTEFIFYGVLLTDPSVLTPDQ